MTDSCSSDSRLICLQIGLSHQLILWAGAITQFLLCAFDQDTIVTVGVFEEWLDAVTNGKKCEEAEKAAERLKQDIIKILADKDKLGGPFSFVSIFFLNHLLS